MASKISVIYITPQAPQPKSTSAILREVMFWSQHFEKIVIMPSFAATLKVLFSGSSNIDLFIISSRFATSDIAEFIFKARQMPRSHDSSMLVILNEAAQKDSPIVLQMLEAGVDAVVFKPYCLEILDHISNLVPIINTRRHLARASVAQIFDGQEMLLLDPVADADLEGKGFDFMVAYFQTRGAATLKVTEKNFHRYLAIANDRLVDTRPARFAISIRGCVNLDEIPPYKGSSQFMTHDATSISLCRARIAEGAADPEIFDRAVEKIRHRLWLLGIQVRFVYLVGDQPK